jgi:hypothetical protein
MLAVLLFLVRKEGSGLPKLEVGPCACVGRRWTGVAKEKGPGDGAKK